MLRSGSLREPFAPQAPTREGFPYGNSNCRSRELGIDARHSSTPSQYIFEWRLISLIVTCVLFICTSGYSDRIESHIEDLKVEDRQVRVHAVRALGQIGPDAKVAVPHLIEALKDEDRQVRGFAAYALGRIGTAAIPHLIEALKDENENVRSDAASALGRIGPDDERVIPNLIEALKDEDRQVRGFAASALGQIGTAAVPNLIEALKDENENVRTSAASALGNIGPDDERVIPNLIEALKDEDRQVRWTSAAALGRIGPDAKAAVPSLIEALKDENENVRTNAAGALGGIGTALQREKDTTAIPDLEMALAALRARNFSEKATRVQRAVEALKAIEKSR